MEVLVMVGLAVQEAAQAVDHLVPALEQQGKEILVA
jgi:hypothetical protein